MATHRLNLGATGYNKLVPTFPTSFPHILGYDLMTNLGSLGVLPCLLLKDVQRINRHYLVEGTRVTIQIFS